MVYKISLPVLRFLRAMGVFPYTRDTPGQAEFRLISPAMGYSLGIFILLLVKTNDQIHFTFGCDVV